MRITKQLTAFVIMLSWIGTSQARASAEPGQSAPALTATELNGDRFDLSAHRGQVVVLAFFATWCDACKAEFPVLSSLYKRLGPKELVILALSADRPRDRKEVERFSQPYGIPTAMLSDAGANGFGSPSSLPIIYVIDRSGVVRARLLPSASSSFRDGLEKAVLPLVQNSPDAKSTQSPSKS